jgi:4-hydroxybenzoate polyprenyltransferase
VNRRVFNVLMWLFALGCIGYSGVTDGWWTTLKATALFLVVFFGVIGAFVLNERIAERREKKEMQP